MKKINQITASALLSLVLASMPTFASPQIAALASHDNDVGLKRATAARIPLDKNMVSAPAPARVKAPAKAAAAGRKFRANVLWQDSWNESGSMKNGIYEFSLDSYNCQSVAVNRYIDGSGGAAYIGDNKYFWTSEDVLPMYGLTIVTHYRANTDTWTYTTQSGEIGGVARSLAWDPSTSTLYGCFKTDDSSGYVFGSFDPDDMTKKRVAICQLDERWEVMSVDRFGTLYTITQSGKLCKVDKGTGRLTEVGNTGVTTKYIAGGAIDPETNLFYYLPTQDTNTYLYAIDLETAVATPLYIMEDGEQLTGLWFPSAGSSTSVPAEITDLKVEPDHSSMTANVSFMAPGADAAGVAQSGGLNYTVVAGGVTLASGTTQWGAPTTARLKFTEPGQYTLAVTVSNSAGSSKEVFSTVYIGNDCPASVAKVTLDGSANNYTVSWDKVTESAHGGLFDPAGVKYDVVRYPGEVTVARNLTDNVFTESLPDNHELMMLYYRVTPSFNGMEGNSTKSNEILHGSALPPYSVRFDSRDALTFLTLEDVNDDGRFWMLSTDLDDTPCLFLYPTAMSDGDDYIFTAPLWLETGSVYNLTAVMGSRYASYGNKETVDLVLATKPSHSAIVETLAKGVSVSQASQPVSASVTVKETGIYYLAVHGCSVPDTYGLYAFSMSVEKSSSSLAPESPVVSAKVAGDVNFDVNVKVTVPSHAINGEPLAVAPEKIELYRDGSVIKTYSGEKAGATLEYLDKGVSEGLHTYSAVAYNADGAGQPGVVKVYAGINVPGAPVNVVARELDDNRSVTVTWDAPVSDRDGCEINPDIISYTVATYNQDEMRWVPVESNITGNSFSYRAIDNSSQVLVKYGVIASTSKGKNENEVGSAPIIAIGDPYPMPYIETFAGNLKGVLGEENDNDASGLWAITAQYDQDGGGNCIQYTGPIGKTGRLFTGKIEITGKNPVFTFWFYSIPTSENEEIVIEANDGSGYKAIGSVPLNRGGTDQHWEKCTVSLDEFIGKAIQLQITYVVQKYILNVDNLRVFNSYNTNLAVRSIATTTHALPDDLILVNAEVENIGQQRSGSVAVALYANGRKLSTQRMNALDPDAKANIEFEVSLEPCDPQNSVLQAVILDSDDLDDDNVSPEFHLTLIHSDLAPVTDLKASRRDGGKSVALTWSQPAVGSESFSVTDGADLMIPFSTGFESSVLDNDYIGDWTMIDVDHRGSAGLSGFAHPNIAPGAELGFIVFNPSLLGITNSGWQPRSGRQMFVCLCAPSGANDDWMVSPRLSGNAQRVSFYAKSAGDKYNEVFEFLYSTGGRGVSDFKVVEKVSGVPASWTKYSFDIPAEAQYFAIRCRSERQFALFVDDITFERRNPTLDSHIAGYNIYRDGERIIAAGMVSETSYVDNLTTDASHSYVVTAVYDKGVAAPSNIATVDDSTGIPQDVAGDELAVTVTCGRGYIDISCPGNLPVDIVLPDGRTAFSGNVSSGAMRVGGLSAGIYIVRIGTQSVRTIVH